jgi:hypothetical protein
MKHILKSTGEKTSSGGSVVYLDGEYLSPKQSQGIYNHSPDGFSYGYLGSGCAQLALAILLKIGDKGIAVAQHQEFKRALIANLPQNKPFEIEFEWPTVEGEYDEDNYRDADRHPEHPDNH